MAQFSKKITPIVLYIAQLLLYILIHVATGMVGSFWGEVVPKQPFLWPPGGIGLVAVLLFGYRFLPGIFLGSFFINAFVFSLPIPRVMFVSIGAMVGTFVAAFVLKRFTSFRPTLSRTKDIILLSFISAPLGSLALATVAATAALLAHALPLSQYAVRWQVYFVSNFVSIVIIVPFLLAWLTKVEYAMPKARRFFEGLLLFLLVYGVSMYLFTDTLGFSTSRTYLVFIPLIWAGLRFGLREMVTIIMIFSLLAVWSTKHGFGPFVTGSISETLMYLQSFMSIVSIFSLVFATSVIERKELEDRKDNFISIASHELRTPLTSIKMVTQLLHRMNKKNGNEKELTYLENMEQQINKMTHLIRDMLDLSKIQAGRLTMEFHKVAIAELIKQTVASMQAVTTRHKIIMEGNFAVDVQGDRDRIGQVLINLLSNAMKYSPRADRIIVRGEVKDKALIISVQDFGIGISKSKIGKIFERFYRVEKDGRKSSGFGLGLFISSEIIKRHGGKIWVESEEGKGSTFYFTLPLV